MHTIVRLVAAALLVVALAAHAQDAKWVGSWGASPLAPSPGAGPFPPTPSFNDQTGRQIVRLRVGGDRVRLRAASISAGVGSPPNANKRWPDLFAERLSARRGGTRFGVVNHGISG